MSWQAFFGAWPHILLSGITSFPLIYLFIFMFLVCRAYSWATVMKLLFVLELESEHFDSCICTIYAKPVFETLAYSPQSKCHQNEM